MKESETILEALRPAEFNSKNPDFPNAPIGWTLEDAKKVAAAENLTLTDVHWEVIRALQEYFSRQEEEGSEHFHARELHDALDEKFHAQGGVKFLYTIFPQGPVAQGCRLAGIEPPASAVDLGFGSVM